ncbi:MAG: glycoside hydrolase family 99-like domain-containing protein, partial [Anaerolineales bacterium]
QDLSGYFSSRPMDYPYEVYKTVCPGWDNEPRKPGRGSTFAFSTPEAYQQWLANACRYALRKEKGNRFVFINAWNEWGEGAHLEPDRRYGYAYLQATLNSMSDLSVSPDGSQTALRKETPLVSAGPAAPILNAPPQALSRDTNPFKTFSGMDDDAWFSLHTDGYRKDPTLRDILPGLPDEELQRQTVGCAGDDALQQGMRISRVFKQLYEKHAGDFSACGNILDFWCSWGQVIRFYLKDIDPSHLWGIDPYDKAIEFCKQSNPWSNFYRNDPFPPTPFQDNMFDLVFSYSVFSHLSEEAHLRWLDEFARIIKPGGLLIVTTWGRDLITRCRDLRKAKDLPAWQRHLPSLFPDSDRFLADYDDGSFCFDTSPAVYGEKSIWQGEACIPVGYVKNRWTRYFEFVEYFFDDKVCSQNIIVVKRNNNALPADQRAINNNQDITATLNSPKIKGPILIYTSGKVGSTSVANGLSDLHPGVPVYQIHLLNNLDNIENELRVRHNPTQSLISVRMGKDIRAEIEKNIDMPWNIITITRDPIARNVSHFFQSIQEFIPDIEERIKNGSISAHDLRDMFLYRLDHFIGELWFDIQLKPIFSIDVFEEPFNKQRGYQIYQNNRFRLLLLRMEDMNNTIKLAMKEFLDIEEIHLPKDNFGSEKFYADLYNDFKKLPLPSIYVEDVYSTQGARHFYTDGELKRFASNWTKGKS